MYAIVCFFHFFRHNYHNTTMHIQTQTHIDQHILNFNLYSTYIEYKYNINDKTVQFKNDHTDFYFFCCCGNPNQNVQVDKE